MTFPGGPEGLFFKRSIAGNILFTFQMRFWHIKNKLFIFNNILDRTAEAVHNGKQTYPKISLPIALHFTVVMHLNNLKFDDLGEELQVGQRPFAFTHPPSEFHGLFKCIQAIGLEVFHVKIFRNSSRDQILVENTITLNVYEYKHIQIPCKHMWYHM